MNRGVPDLVRFGSLYDRFLANHNAIFHNSAFKCMGEGCKHFVVRTENGSKGCQFVGLSMCPRSFFICTT